MLAVQRGSLECVPSTTRLAVHRMQDLLRLHGGWQRCSFLWDVLLERGLNGCGTISLVPTLLTARPRVAGCAAVL